MSGSFLAFLSTRLHCSSLNRVTCAAKVFGIYSECVSCSNWHAMDHGWSILLAASAEATEMPTTISFGAMLNLPTRQGFPSSNSTALNWERRNRGYVAQVHTVLQEEEKKYNVQSSMFCTVQMYQVFSLYSI
jgi:hypothetical protein